MPKGGPVFRVGGGVKFSKSLKKGGCFFKIQIRGGGKLLETVVSTVVYPFCTHTLKVELCIENSILIQSAWSL